MRTKFTVIQSHPCHPSGLEVSWDIEGKEPHLVLLRVPRVQQKDSSGKQLFAGSPLSQHSRLVCCKETGGLCVLQPGAP